MPALNDMSTLEIIEKLENCDCAIHNAELERERIQEALWENMDPALKTCADNPDIKFEGGLRGWVSLCGRFDSPTLRRILQIMDEVPPGPKRERFNR